MAREPFPTWFFVFTVVRRGDRFLLVHERKHGQGWYLPAGRVEPGESLTAAALRETLEEAGVPIVLDGILRIDHAYRPSGTRVRVYFTAHPADDTPPKTTPDDESLGAAWITLDELGAYPLRGPEVVTILAHVAAGGAVHPLSLLAAEGDPWR